MALLRTAAMPSVFVAMESVLFWIHRAFRRRTTLVLDMVCQRSTKTDLASRIIMIEQAGPFENESTLSLTPCLLLELLFSLGPINAV